MLWHHAAAPCCGTMLRHHAAATCCGTMLRHHAAATCCGTMLRQHAAAPCCGTMLRHHAAAPCCGTMLRHHAAAPCCGTMLRTHGCWRTQPRWGRVRGGCRASPGVREGVRATLKSRDRCSCGRVGPREEGSTGPSTGGGWGLLRRGPLDPALGESGA